MGETVIRVDGLGVVFLSISIFLSIKLNLIGNSENRFFGGGASITPSFGSSKFSH